MKNILISLMFVLLFMVVSCGGEDTEGNLKPSDCTGKLPNYHKGLCWSDASSDSMTWDPAKAYCKSLGGRLPTISELRTLIENCPGTETGGECGVTDSCLSYGDCWNNSCDSCSEADDGRYSVFGDTYWFWSSSELSDNADGVWYVDFDYGYVNFSSKDNLIPRVRCLQ